MPKIEYVAKTFSASNMALIHKANEIIVEYQAQGFDLTLRQVYYQFVARDLIKNTLQSYKHLGSIINDARLAGMIDWEAIVDRTRNLVSNSHWDGPKDIVMSCARQFQIDKWAGQEYRPEVWIEKDALAGVIERVCRENDVPFFSCRGYTSQSEMWVASQRLQQYADDGQTPVIIHLGDHDPSGIDMTRDIEDRLQLFMGGLEVNRIALNMDQVDKYSPPPNPCKVTDSRSGPYITKFGHESWELDALEPRVLEALILKAINSVRDQDTWEERVQLEDEHKASLLKVAKKLD